MILLFVSICIWLTKIRTLSVEAINRKCFKSVIVTWVIKICGLNGINTIDFLCALNSIKQYHYTRADDSPSPARVIFMSYRNSDEPPRQYGEWVPQNDVD